MLLLVVSWLVFGLLVPLYWALRVLGKSLSYAATQPTSSDGPVRRSLKTKDLSVVPDSQVKTLYDVLRCSAARFPQEHHLFGTRTQLGTVDEDKQITTSVGGVPTTTTKRWQFAELSGFAWMTYRQVVQATTEIGAGLVKIGLKSNDKVTLFASTGRDWMIMAHSCFTQSMVITTAYDNLGEQGLAFSLNEGQVTTLFTQTSLFDVVKKVSHVESLKNVVYTGTVSDSDLDAVKQAQPHLTFYSIEEIRQLGVSNPCPAIPPSSDDLACIMYTSGSTGNPKGVMLTHGNIVAAVAGAYELLKGELVLGEETYLAYLPLAHILEFTVEHFFMYFGAKIGYGSPRSLTDAMVRNCKGDICELKPTVMAGVPAVWETIRKGVLAKVKASGGMKEYMFNLAFQAKRGLIELGLPTGLIDPIFKPIRDSTGGRLKMALSGGAPVAAKTQEFLTVTLCPVLQGYGMTETSGVLCMQGLAEAGVYGSVGGPHPSIEMKLVKTGGYSPNPTDPSEPPRGEIWARGANIMKGYFKQPETTSETLTSDGWLMTGDIGEWQKDGTLKIIDRKKNLVKLSHGEYVALEKLEAQYKTSSYVQNMCIHADPLESHIVAIIVPVPRDLTALAETLGVKGDLDQICSDAKVTQQIAKEMRDIAQQAGFKGAEILKALVLVPGEWTPENEMLTAAQKLKRKQIVQAYSKHIDKMYGRNH